MANKCALPYLPSRYPRTRARSAGFMSCSTSSCISTASSTAASASGCTGSGTIPASSRGAAVPGPSGWCGAASPTASEDVARPAFTSGEGEARCGDAKVRVSLRASRGMGVIINYLYQEAGVTYIDAT